MRNDRFENFNRHRDIPGHSIEGLFLVHRSLLAGYIRPKRHPPTGGLRRIAGSRSLAEWEYQIWLDKSSEALRILRAFGAQRWFESRWSE
jgi:hypothetical protein